MKKLKIASIVNEAIYTLIALALIAFYLDSKEYIILILLTIFLIYLLKRSLLTFIAILIISFLYIVNYHYQYEKLYQIDDSQNIVCIINSIPVKKTSYVEFQCSTPKNNFLIRVTSDEIDYQIGDYLKLQNNLELVKHNTIPYQFNYAKFLQSQNIAYINKVDKVKVIKKATLIHYRIINRIIDYYQESQIKPYILSFIIGNKKALDEEFLDNAQILNISHLFVVSGFHVGFLYYFMRFFLKHLRITKETIEVICIIMLLFFLVINLFAFSVLRAVMLIILVNIKNKYKIPCHNGNILSLIFCINLLLNPFALQNVGFVLSYLITLILFMANETLLHKTNYFFSLFKVNFLAQLFSLPIISNFNFNYNFFSIILSPILTLYYTFIIFPAILIGLIIKPCDFLLHYCFQFYEISISSLSKINSFEYNIGCFTVIRMILYYFILVNILKKLEIKKFSFLFCGAFIVISFFYHKVTITDEIIFFDVGQGDSILIRSDINSCKALIDTSGSYFYHPGANVAKYLKSIQTKRIDLLFFTHTDNDHAGDYEYILNEFEVKTIVFNVYDDSPLQKEIEEVAKTKKINILKLKAYNKVDCGALSFYILNPMKKNNTDNDNSLVLFLLFNGDNYLFMGDASVNLVKTLSIKKIDFIKVSHHGSQNENDYSFYESFLIKHAIISVGKNNYRHPDKYLLKMFEERNITYYRTDINGSISVKYYLTKKRIIYHYPPII